MARVVEETLAASAARTATASFTPSAELTHGGSADQRYPVLLEVQIVSTAISLTPSVVFSIEIYNPASATWISVLSGTAITNGSTTQTLRVGPYQAASANVAAQAAIGRLWRVTATHADTDSITYSVLGRVFFE